MKLFSKKMLLCFAGMEKVFTFAPAIENDTVAKEEVL